jgi:hypothetical protein
VGDPVNTLTSINVGSGSAGAFYKDTDNDTDNDSPALDVFSNGKAPGMRVQKAKSTKPKLPKNGSVALFQLLEPENESDAVVIQTTGKGRAGTFTINNQNNINTALVGMSNGNGGSCISAYTEAINTLGGNFQVHNENSTAYALQVLNNGKKAGLYLEALGEGQGAIFITKGDKDVPGVVYPAIGMSNYAAGYSRVLIFGNQENVTARCAEFLSNNALNNEACLVSIHNGSGQAIMGKQTSLKDSPALLIQKYSDNPNWAAIFEGNVWVKGNIEKSSGNFKIDHPLDPENKYLVHSFVESPEMKNIYDGIAVLDKSGEAIVTMPEWFDALNKDFRYQLTCIGGYAQVYITEEMNGNKFKIAGGRQGLKVSWMVTGIRHDPYAEANPLVVEQLKKENEKGKYIFPSLYNKPETQAVGYEFSNMKPSKMEGTEAPFKVNHELTDEYDIPYKVPDTTLLKPKKESGNKESK